MASKEFFYGRVSAKDQNEGRQIEMAKKLGIPDENIFIDKKSGKDFDREEYLKLMQIMREDDLIYIPSLERLGRNYSMIEEEWRRITKEICADISVLDMDILNTRVHKDLLGTLIADIVLRILGYVAEKQRDDIRTTQRQGIDLCMKENRPYGRPKIEIDRAFIDVYCRWKDDEMTATTAMKLLGNMSKNTFYRRVKEYENR